MDEVLRTANPWDGLDESAIAELASRSTLHALFEEQVGRSPDADAVVCEGGSIAYRDLDRRANQLAHALRRRHVGADVMVGVRMERSIEMVVALLGILKAGGAYVPIDPSYPPERSRFMVEDAGVPVLLTQQRLLSSQPAVDCETIVVDTAWESIAAESDTRPEATAGSRNLAYMIYTSGSTGRPKGVMNEHRGVLNRLLWQQTVRPLSPRDSLLQKTTFSFDVSVFELFLPLLTGARLFLARPGGQQDPDYLVRTIADHGITVVHFVPSMLRVFLDARGVESCTCIEHILCSGEALPADVVTTCHRKLPASVLNLYGPTEAAVEVTYWKCPRDWTESAIPIGRPIANTRCHILSPDLVSVSAGEAGELCIGGIQVARGYHHLPELTRERFIPDPFDPSSDARLYRTGDLARMRADGAIDYLGRLDQQVKIRGFRIEPGEIESALGRHPAVCEAAVVASRSDPAQQSLTANLVLRPGRAPTVRDLRQHLLESLPEYMVPASFVVIDRMPHLHSGKIDRATLASSPGRPLPVETPFVAPATETECRVAAIWREHLRVESVGLDDDFIELGGHSLAAMRIASAINRTCDIGLSLSDVLSANTVRAVAGAVERLRGVRTVGADSSMARVDRTGPLPLSSAQRQMFLESLRAPDTPVYNEPVAIRLGGSVDVGILEQALEELVRQHEILRTTYAIVDSEPVQMIQPATSFVLPVADFRTIAADERKKAALDFAARDCALPFDLGRAPILRATLVILEENDWRLLVTLHHIAADGVTLSDLFPAELHRLYCALGRGESPSVPSHNFQYADFSHWQRRGRTGVVTERQLAYWRGKLAGAQSMILRGDRPRPPVFTYRGGRASFTLSRELSAAIHSLSRQHGCTPFVALLAAFNVLLCRETGDEDVVIGSVTAGRDSPEAASMFGCFLNYLVLRTDLSGDPGFAELLGRVRTTVLEAADHQEVSLTRLADELKPPRTTDRHPFYQIMFLMEPPPSRAGGEWSVCQMDYHPGTTKLDLTFALDEVDGEFIGRVEYCSEIFERPTVDRLVSTYRTLLESIVRDPSARISALPLLGPAEQRRVVHEWNATAFAHPRDALLHELVERQAARTPESIAVCCERECLTYRELAHRSQQLAHHLVTLGIGPDTPVAVCLERSCDMVAALLAVLQAGGTFVPVDVTYPRERIALMLADAQPRAIVTRSALLDQLQFPGSPIVDLDRDREILRAHSASPVSTPVAPAHLAYIIYTSGSTGEPKGVMISHLAICNHMLWMQRAYPLNGHDAVLQKTACSFDASIWEFFAPLIAGARLVMARPGDPYDPLYLASTIAQHGVTRLQLVPSVLEMLLAEPEFARARLPLRDVFCGGEALKPVLCEAFAAAFPGVALHNLYGPAETTIDATVWDCVPGSWIPSVPIGRPIDNVRAYVVDRFMNPVPAGVVGELLIGGAGVARGYWNKPGLTRERFVGDPFSGEEGSRLYKTGDLARYRPDGVLEFLGRNDAQIKIRGIRIEPAEIETALLKLPGVAQAAVIAIEGRGHDFELVAYVVPRPGARSPIPEELLAALRRQLPASMTPATIIVVPAFPLSPSGKLDRTSLPRPAVAFDSSATFEPGDDPISGVLAAIWCDVLGLAQFDPARSFFELGGHSLQAIRLVSRIRTTLRVDVALPVFLRDASFNALVEHVRAKCRSQPSAPPPKPAARPTPAPLSSGQRQLWFLHRLDPTGAGHNVIFVLRMRGPINPAALERALSTVVARHEALRTTFPIVDGEPRQSIDQNAGCAGMRLARDIADAGAAFDVTLDRVRSEENRRRFDLEAGPLFVPRLVSDGHDEHALVLNLHHIVADEPSEEILFRDIAHAYTHVTRTDNCSDGLPAIDLHPADFAIWEHAPERDEQRTRNLKWWCDALGGAPLLLNLPTDRPRPATPSFRGQRAFDAVAHDVADELGRIARTTSATPFMVFLAAWSSFLGRLCGQTDVVIGAPVSLRSLGPLDHTVGFFLNTLPFHLQVGAGGTFRELLARARAAALDVYAHADAPFDKLVETLQPVRLAGVSPVYQVMLVMRGSASRAPSIPGVVTSVVDHHPDSAKVDMTLLVAEREGTFELTLEYRNDLFCDGTAAGWLEDFVSYLGQLAREPDGQLAEAACLSPRSRAWQLETAGLKTSGISTDATMCALVATQARRVTEAVAIHALGTGPTVTHAQLDRLAATLATAIRDRAAGHEPLVGICFERSPGMIAAMLGAMRAGAGYVPLDPKWPSARLRWMIHDAGVNLILAGRGAAADGIRSVLAEGENGERAVEILEINPEHPVAPEAIAPMAGTLATPESVAYVIYTSGSTGEPKGVAVEHRQLVASTRARESVYAGNPSRFLLLSPAVFDSSVAGIYWTLAGGGALVLPPTGAEQDPRLLADLIVEHGITHYLCLPSLHALLLEELRGRLHRLQTVIVAGEPCPVTLPPAHRDILPAVRLFNEYGPTEGTVWCTAADLTSALGDSAIPIGRPIPTARVYVVDDRLRFLPRGAAGEIVIAGDGLARGYHRRPELSATRFLGAPPGELPEARIYRTGDLGRWLPDGRLMYCGRTDDQVKIRGHRIEPGEIESALLSVRGVQEAAVVAVARGHAGPTLVGHIVSEEPSPDADEFRRQLRQRLPDYMVPALFVFTKRLPRTTNGKVDRRALASVELSGAASVRTPLAPRTELEAQLVRVWERVLGLSPVGVRDDFFDIGGHSLLAVKLAHELTRDLGRSVPLATVLLARTVEEMATRLGDGALVAAMAGPGDLRGSGPGTTLFNIPGYGGVGVMPKALADRVAGDRRYFDGLLLPGVEGEVPPIEDAGQIATELIRQIRRVQPHGPYALTGFCLGGVFAYEVAQQFLAAGEEVRGLALWHTFPFRTWRERSQLARLAEVGRRTFTHESRERREFVGTLLQQQSQRLRSHARRAVHALMRNAITTNGSDEEISPWNRAQEQAGTNYLMKPYAGPLLVLRATRLAFDESLRYELTPHWGWEQIARGPLEIRDFDCDHMNMIREPFLARVAESTAEWLQKIDGIRS